MLTDVQNGILPAAGVRDPVALFSRLAVIAMSDDLGPAEVAVRVLALLAHRAHGLLPAASLPHLLGALLSISGGTAHLAVQETAAARALTATRADVSGLQHAVAATMSASHVGRSSICDAADTSSQLPARHARSVFLSEGEAEINAVSNAALLEWATSAVRRLMPNGAVTAARGAGEAAGSRGIGKSLETARFGSGACQETVLQARRAPGALVPATSSVNQQPLPVAACTARFWTARTLKSCVEAQVPMLPSAEEAACGVLGDVGCGMAGIPGLLSAWPLPSHASEPPQQQQRLRIWLLVTVAAASVSGTCLLASGDDVGGLSGKTMKARVRDLLEANDASSVCDVRSSSTMNIALANEYRTCKLRC
jgi:hypothetical protein